MPDELITSIADFATLPTPAAIFDLDGTFLAINRACEVLMGRPAAAIVGRKAWEFAPGVEHIWAEIVATARKHGMYAGTLTLATPDAPRGVRFVNTLRDHAGTTYMLSFANALLGEAGRDATEESQHRLEALGLVAGGIAQDFNNQLVSVLAEASVARENEGVDAATREALRRIEAAAHRMAQLTRQLLAYAGRGRFVTEVLDPDDLVRDAHEPLARSVRADAQVQLKTNGGGVAVEVDRSLLRQVLQNLVANASEALLDDGGIITISSHVDDGAWVLEIADTGTGMDAYTAARIFDPFFTTKRDRKGLGLSAVHGIVRRHGGAISVDTTVGGGSRFRVRLPVIGGVVPPRTRPSSTSLPMSTLRGVRVLVADDESGVLATVKRLLERRGAEVVVAADGAQAKARLAQGEYGIVLFDVMMPEATGYELVPIARKLQPRARVMLMSGFTEQARTYAGHEPDAFLEKPFTAKALDAAIDGLLG